MLCVGVVMTQLVVLIMLGKCLSTDACANVYMWLVDRFYTFLQYVPLLGGNKHCLLQDVMLIHDG